MLKNDRYNTTILRELQNNARISNADLADKIGLSPSACLRRVQELENSGVIKRYKAVLDSEKLGNHFLAFVNIGLNEHTHASQKAFEEAIKPIEEVKECHNVTGAFEYLLRVESHDIQSYKKLHTEILGEIPQVARITTHVVMESPKDER